MQRLIGAESRGKRSRGDQAWVRPKTKFFPELERERKQKKREEFPLLLLPSRHVL